MQMAFSGAEFPGGKCRAACHVPMAEVSEISDALRHYMLPHLDLQRIVQLASSCRAWHELISHTTVDRVSDSVRHALLPSGLISDLPLLELVEHQAELMARLRCDYGFSPRIQPLSLPISLRNDVESSSQRDRCTRESPIYLKQLVWPPCRGLESDSHWLLLLASQNGSSDYILMHAQTGQQVRFQEACLSTKIEGTSVSAFRASWLGGQPRLLLHPVITRWRRHRYAVDPREIRVADASTNRVSAITLSGAHHEGNSQLFAACDEKGCAKKILAWVAAPVACKHLQDHIMVYDVSCSWQPLYQLACPESVVQRFMQLHSKHISPDLRSSQGMQGRDWCIDAQKSMLSPDGKLLAIAWQISLVNASAHPNWPEMIDEVKGLSIHSAIEGECTLSMVLMPGQTPPCWDDPPSWIPNSSNLMYRSSDGLHVVSSTGRLFWSQTTSQRTPDLATNPLMEDYRYYIATSTSASECGRWICVMDELSHPDMLGLETFARDGIIGQTSIVAATSGLVLHQHMTRGPPGPMCDWSKLGAACLLPQSYLSPRVLAACSTTSAVSQAFCSMELLSLVPGPNRRAPYFALNPHS